MNVGVGLVVVVPVIGDITIGGRIVVDDALEVDTAELLEPTEQELTAELELTKLEIVDDELILEDEDDEIIELEATLDASLELIGATELL